jgi:hypothetical protein
MVLTARHGVSIAYEGVPRTLEGVNVAHFVDESGVRHPRMVYPQVRFTYPASHSPRQVGQAALEAWNAQVVDAHYKLVEVDGILHFVPYEVRTPEGSYVPFRSLMDTRIHLDRTRGTPTQLYRDVLAELVAATGVPIEDASEGLVGRTNPQRPLDWDTPQQDEVTLPSADGTARELMDAVLVAGGRETGWQLIWVVNAHGGKGGWSFGFTLATPRDELLWNGTPSGPAPP